MRFYQPVLFGDSGANTLWEVNRSHAAPGQAPTILVFFNEEGDPLATLVPS